VTFRDDITPEDALTAAELRDHYRPRLARALSCSDGFCGGCPRCGVPLDEPETEEAPCA
jgi:hypothetical protein